MSNNQANVLISEEQFEALMLVLDSAANRIAIAKLPDRNEARESAERLYQSHKTKARRLLVGDI